MEAIGRLYDAVVIPPNNTSLWVSLKDAEALTAYVVSTGTAAVATVRIAQDASGTNAQLYGAATGVGTNTYGDGLTRVLTRSVAAGSAWVGPVAPTSVSTVTTTATAGDMVALDIAGYQLPDQFKYVQVTHVTGYCVLQPHDLLVQRKPVNLRALTA